MACLCKKHLKLPNKMIKLCCGLGHGFLYKGYFMCILEDVTFHCDLKIGWLGFQYVGHGTMMLGTIQPNRPIDMQTMYLDFFAAGQLKQRRIRTGRGPLQKHCQNPTSTKNIIFGFGHTVGSMAFWWPAGHAYVKNLCCSHQIELSVCRF